MAKLEKGKFIKINRYETNETQNAITEDICEEATLSRIESGKQNMHINSFKNLVDMLHTNAKTFHSPFLCSDDFTDFETREKIQAYLINKEQEKALEQLEKLKTKLNINNSINEQFIKSIQAQIFIIQHSDIKQGVAMLEEALYVTRPQFRIEEVQGYLLTFEEYTLLNHIGMAYAKLKEYETAVILFTDIIKSVESTMEDDTSKDKKLINAYYNLADIYVMACDYDAALIIIEECIAKCLYYKKIRTLAQATYIKAYCLYQNGVEAEYAHILHNCFETYKSIHAFHEAEILKSNAKEIFGIDL